MLIHEINNKIPLKRDASGPEGYQWVVENVYCLVSMLKKLRPVVGGLTLQGGGVHMNPKDNHVAAVS